MFVAVRALSQRSPTFPASWPSSGGGGWDGFVLTRPPLAQMELCALAACVTWFPTRYQAVDWYQIMDRGLGIPALK